MRVTYGGVHEEPNRVPLLVMSYCAFLLNTSLYCLSVSLKFCQIMGALMDAIILVRPPKGPYALLDSPSSHQPLKEKQKRPGFLLPLIARPIQQIW